MRSIALIVVCIGCATPSAEPPLCEHGVQRSEDGPPAFRKRSLDCGFVAESVALGDIDRDGVRDLVVGPFWFRGPSFEERHEWREPVYVDVASFSDAFITFTHDVDVDGHVDVIMIGIPGEPARWYRNPGDPASTRWAEHVGVAAADGESPAFTDVTGDGAPELLHFSQGRLGYSTPVASGPWPFTALTPHIGGHRYSHGLGTGDVNSDGRVDLLESSGWWEQPQHGSMPWIRHAQGWSEEGGAQMASFDVDGDGDADVVTSLAAHGYGLAWFEQTEPDTFVRHLIMDDTGATTGPYGVRFSQPHALAVADLDSDGVLDLVTGKRRFAHGPSGDPEPLAAPVTYAFLTRRGSGSVRFAPRLLDDTTGVGTQILAEDADEDGDVEVIVANKLGVSILSPR